MQRIKPRLQERSSRSASQLAKAAYELMQERPLDQVTVAEIVQRAGLSVGAFYARFGCKEALLDWLCQDHLRRNGAAVQEQLVELERQGADLRQLVTAYVELVAEFYERHAPLLREVLRLAYGRANESVLRQTVQVNADIDDANMRLLLTRRSEMGHPHPERALSFLPPLVAAMLSRSILLRPTLPERSAELPTPDIRKELVEWILTALQNPRP